ncbi:MAG: UDP-3-O-(3-hydroxymyristoyl)glucosamine N-acyltransferase [Armatimonadetes bacterium]|nr:UDP-3-O-(3-hydroxymyristoyl)glucosamine N-acyltransferase [Armatimonadota bacterium]
MSYLLSQLAEMLDGHLVGDDVEITGLAALSDAVPGDLSFLDSPKYLRQAETTAASALLVPPGVEVPGRSAVQVEKPRIAFARTLSLFNGHAPPAPFVHPTAVIEEGASVSPSATLMAYAYVGANSVIGEGALLHPFVHVGQNVKVGPGSVLFSHVTLYDRVRVGERVRLHSGVVIGADGFGYERENGRHLKVPHIGTVIVEDDVEIGANSCVDRAKTGATRIGRGTKIDNLVHVGHNVKIGERCIILALAGLSGSVEFEDDVILGGQVGVRDHMKIGRGAKVASQSGVMAHVPAGATMTGTPAIPHPQWLKMTVASPRLPEMLHQMRKMERRIQELEAKLADDSHDSPMNPAETMVYSTPPDPVAADPSDEAGDA